MKCKNCQTEKCKEPVVRNDTTRFVDHKGKLWNGKVCPECYREYNRMRMRKSRADLKLKEALS